MNYHIKIIDPRSNCCAAGVLPGDLCDECRQPCGVTEYEQSPDHARIGELDQCSYDELEPRD